MNKTTYASAGVDIRREAGGVGELIRQLTFRRTGRVRMTGDVGHYAGMIQLGDQVLAMTIDGVGTKMLVADRLANWRTVGIDCIAMNVNDLFVMNIEPVAFVDYIATDRVDPDKMAQLGTGLNEGARLANIDIVGGETATLAGLVTGLDLAGCCIGVQERDRVITGEAIRPGDRIVGVPSSGVHSNGLTLARRVVDLREAWDECLPGGRTIGEELLTPTRIYHEVLSVAARYPVHGMCHVTGGGLLNFTRLTRYGFRFADPLPAQEIFRWVARNGDVEEDEMYRTFNMGMGFALVVPVDSASAVASAIPGARVVGEVTEEPGVLLRDEPVR